MENLQRVISTLDTFYDAHHPIVPSLETSFLRRVREAICYLLFMFILCRSNKFGKSREELWFSWRNEKEEVIVNSRSSQEAGELN